MKRSNLLIFLYLALIFASGVAVGAFGYRMYSPSTAIATQSKKPSPDEWRREYLKSMQDRVHVTPTQVAQLSQILDDTRARVQDLHERSDRERKQIHADHVARVRAILTPEQQPEYDKLRAEREQRKPGPR